MNRDGCVVRRVKMLTCGSTLRFLHSSRLALPSITASNEYGYPYVATHLYTYVSPVKEKDIQAICAILADDGVIAMPMDVAWSFVCNAASSKALERIHRLKPTHPKEQPFSLICDSISMAAHLANIDNIVYPWLKKAMPGPFTILLERHSSLPKQIHDKRKTVGIRIPACELVSSVVKRFEKPLAASTIVLSKDEDSGVQQLPGFGWEVAEAFGHGLDMIADIGLESPRQETTIIDLTSGAPELIRQGMGNPVIFDL